MLPAERRQHILDQLAQQGAVRVADLAQALAVSEMTIHRDLDHLAAQSRLCKVRGGAVPPAGSETQSTDEACCICHHQQPSRTPMLLYLEDGTHRHTCCPHCGLMALLQLQLPLSAVLVTDFLYGRTVSGQAASYVLAPKIRLCCTPAVLAFEERQEAKRFRRGFGGQVLDLDGALAYLQRQMAVTPAKTMTMPKEQT
jgi:hypothetical protein